MSEIRIVDIWKVAKTIRESEARGSKVAPTPATEEAPHPELRVALEKTMETVK